MAGSSVRPVDVLATPAVRRRFPVGAEYLGNGQTHIRVWAPASREATVVSAGTSTPLAAENAGYFSGLVALTPGSRYQFQLTDGERLYPDPASRFQPDGPHGSSEVIDPAGFTWTDSAWPGVQIAGQVVYEMHVGTFTREGTWVAASRELAELARIGITLIEMMPVADFNGRFGWGYDGVDLFAPTRLYGRPDDLRQFVDRAHALGVGVILDVVYNHLGPSGNYLRAFSPAYFSDKYENEWGDAINFDGDGAAPVRELFETNAAYWIDEFHFDGLRLDATQQIFDQSDEHIIQTIGRAARQAAGSRSIVLVAENEPQETRLVRPITDGGYGLDALWNDDFHHSAMVAITGRSEAYYNDTYGEPQEFVSAAKYGYLYQGQYYAWQRQPRGTPAFGLSPAQFVVYLQNHDQVANSARGQRAHQLTSAGRWRAITALTLLMPSTPMLFQGQEFSSSAPFLYFADFDAELSSAIRKGRGEFLTQFPSIVDFEARATLDDPASPLTFERCKVDFIERERHAGIYRLHEDLLRLRREDAAFQTTRERSLDGAVLSPHAFMLRLFADDHSNDRILIVNLGADLTRPSIAEPLLAPPPERDWTVLWNTEDPRYGGGGMPDLWPNGCWRIPGESAVVLGPGPMRNPPKRAVRRRTA
jgi:maltooligosyltrehalose trehalohydrolase